MNRKTLLAVTGAALLGIAGLAAYAAGGPTPPPDGPRFERGSGPGFGGDFMPPGLMHPGMLNRLADKLNLTDSQRTTIKGYFEAARPTLQSLREDMRSNEELLRNTKPDASNYSSVVSQASQKAGDLARRLVTEGSQLRAQVWEVLTPEQRAKLDEMQANFKERGKNHGRGHGPHGPAEGAPESN